MRDGNRRPRVRLLLAIAFVSVMAVSFVGAPVDARPPPQEVCVACSDSFVGVAEENDVDVGVAGSSLTIEIDRSGTGYWTERVRLTGEGVETLRTDPALRDQVVEETFERGYVAVDDPKGLTTSMNGDTLVVEYDVPAMAHESVGDVLVVDFFYWHGGEARWFSLAADSMTMQGPPGTVVTYAPDDATVHDGALTWAGSDQQYDPLGTRSHVVFAQDNSVVSQAASTAGVGVDVAQLKAGDGVAVIAPLAILASLLVLLRRYGRRLSSLPKARQLGIVLGPLVAVGIAAATFETLVGVSGPVTAQLGDFVFYLVYVVAATGAGPALVFGGVLVIGQLMLARRILGSVPREGSAGTRDATKRLLVLPPLVVLAVQWLFFPVAAAGAAGYDATYGLASLVIPVLLFVPLAVTRRWDGWRRAALSLGIVVAPLPVVTAFAPHTGMGLVIRSLALQYVPWALVVGAIGTLAYVSMLGMRTSEG